MNHARLTNESTRETPGPVKQIEKGKLRLDMGEIRSLAFRILCAHHGRCKAGVADSPAPVPDSAQDPVARLTGQASRRVATAVLLLPCRNGEACRRCHAHMATEASTTALVETPPTACLCVALLQAEAHTTDGRGDCGAHVS